MKRPHLTSAPRARFVCAVLTLALFTPHFSLLAAAGGAGSKGSPKNVNMAAQTAAPESNLPDLDETRLLSPAAPQAPPPIPSTRCSPSNPYCVPSGGASNRVPGADARPMPADQLARSSGSSEFVSILGNRVNSVSDSGFALLGEAFPSPARPHASAGGPSPFATQPLMASGVFADDFNDNSTDASKWSAWPTSNGNVVEQGRRLEVTPPASTTGYNGYFAVPTYDLTGGRAAVEVAQTTALVYGIETHFYLVDNATGNYLLFVTSGSNFAFQSVTSGVMSRVVIPYDAARHRFWRFRHETAGDQLVWETSQDGLVWVVRRRIARPFPLTSLQARLLAGKYTASTPTSTAVFDNLRLEPDPARRVFFADDFDDDARDAAKWNFYGPGSPATAIEQNRRLEITPSPTTTGYNGYQSVAAYDLTDAGIVAEVPQATAGNAETHMALWRDGANSLIIAVSAGSILFQDYTAGVRSRLYVPYDPSQHRFWRIRHDAGADTIIWETSADGVVWVTQRTSPRPFPVTSMVAQIVAGKWTNTGASAPGKAVYDNFRLERNAPAYSPSDNFNDNALDAARWTVVAPASSVTAREQNQRIEFALQPNTAAYNWVSSAQTVDLTSRTLQTEFVQATHQGGSTEAFFRATLDGANFFHMGASTGYLVLDVMLAGVRDRVLLTYNPTTDRFLRMRHNLAAHTMNFETSADSKAWATRRVVPVVFSLGALKVELGAGAWATYSSAPGTAVFDNLRLEQNDPNGPPTVGLTAPANGASASAPANITLTADASDSDGQVAKVEFYQGATKLGEDTTAPYGFNWNGVAAGSYGLTARAMDGDGAVVTSAVVSITVSAANGSPAVGITGPANNAQFTAGDAVTITADASDADGSVTKVEFYQTTSQGTVKLGEDTTAPYSFTWNNVAAGSYSLTAKATDNYNPPAVTTSNPVNISVVPPTVTVAAADAAASEAGTDTGKFTLSRTGSTAAALTVNFAVGGTATAATDYNSVGASVTILAGASSATLTVTPVEDSAVEGNETVVLTLAGNTAYTLGSPSSATVTIADNDTHPPTVQINSPAGGAVFTAPASVTITASAADQDGLVVKVEFFGNGVKLGEDTAAPYNYTWSGGAANNYSLTAKATDNVGATATSAPVNIIVNARPTVSLTAPAAGSVHTAPANINITANASDADGSVAKVEFFRDGVKLGEDALAPFSLAWNGVSAGSYTLTAVATDNRGAAATSAAVGVAVNSPPAVSLASPAAGSVFSAPANITLIASASDADGTVSKVEFYQGATKLGEDTSAPYDFTWSNVAAGSYSLTARATDNTGATVASAPVNVSVVNALPSVSIASPAAGLVFTAPADIAVSANASDPDGAVVKVEFFGDGVLLGEDTTEPYSFNWNGVAAGSYALTARATDSNGATVTSAAVSVLVNSPPSVSITFPTAGSSFAAPASITIDAIASDEDGSVVKVEFFNDDGGKIGEDTTAPYSLTWNNVPAGGFTLYAVATDNVGAGSFSGMVNVVIDAESGVALAAPAAFSLHEAPADLTLRAYTGVPSVTKVEFYANGVKLGEDTLAPEEMGEGVIAPYEFAWSNVPSGSYALFARAIQSSGATSTSSTVSITVTNSPVVNLTSPAAGTVFSPPANITLTADAFDPDGSILKVEFYRGATMIGDDFTEPYSFTWSNVAAGDYSLTARAIDNVGSSIISAPVNVTVNGPPWTSITSPAAGSVFYAPAAISINAHATDPGGWVAKVEFFGDGVLLGEDTSWPYTFTWHNVAVGVHALTTRATDNTGLTATSAAVNVDVRQGNTPPTVSITGPADEAKFAVGASVAISANASDADGAVSKVEFFRGATKLGEDTTAPYSFAWSGVPAGSHVLTARATDNNGAQTTSAAVTVHALDFTAARLDPRNRTGADDLFSRNFNWGVSLVSLPGRSGLDLDLALSYNSLVWTKSQTGSAVLFDGDRGFPTPGFRFGFPVIQGPYVRTLDGSNVNVFILVTPSGGRVELRQVAPDRYESADSSNLLLEASGTTLVLRPADGSRLTYSYMGGEYQCVEVKDAHGNYLTVTYTSFGRIHSVTDTLGRVVTVHYDAFQNPIRITQVRTVGAQQQEHVWATFGYENRTISTAFGGLTVFGAEAGRPVPVLTQVGLDDGTRHNFSYNEWGQVERVTRSAQNAGGQWVQLAYTEYTLAADGADCPRFTGRKDWARDWNKVGGAEEPVTTSFSVEGDMQVVTLPDGTQKKVRYAADGFKRGLPTATETWGTEGGGRALRKSTTTRWEQDNATLSYAHNPRVTETTVSDGVNTRRTVVEYLPVGESPFRLPTKVLEYQGASTLLRYAETDYEPASRLAGGEYVNLRIIGLVSKARRYDADGVLQSSISYEYDKAGCVENAGDPIRHDAGYGVTAKRGLVCSVLRNNVGVVNADNPASVETKTVYNTAGAALYTLDPLGHKTSVGYDDNFSDGVSRNTFAYPTSATDPDQNAPEVPEAERKRAFTTYDFDTGAVTRARDVKGAERVLLYDEAMRVVRATRRDGVNQSDQGYTRFVYSPTQDFVQTFTQIDAGVESYSVQVFDGAGRVRGTASDFPNSAGPQQPRGNYTGVVTRYDAMGRAVFQSNPTEMLTTADGWVPAGDDYNGGEWRGTTQQYDWMGRPTVTTNADGTTNEAAYGGCGCAGGEVVTMMGEGLAEGRRRQKLYHDPLGRAVKAELLNWDGSVYSTTTTRYDALDRAVRVRRYVGAAPAQEPEAEGSTYQTTTLTYDGHGRLWTRHAPEQEANRDTVYLYHADDTVRSVTDARGAKATYTYNARHLPRLVDYDTTGVIADQNVAETPDVSFVYDEAGNRESMDDGPGSVSYTYDRFSRLKTETRAFDGVGSYALTYDYTLAGALKEVTDPTGAKVEYGYDGVGRLTSVTGPPVGVYASGMEYRAWGALKKMSYGNGVTHSFGYDARLRAGSFAATANAGATTLMSGEYQYYADGRARYARDLRDAKFNRAYKYDHAGRLSEAYTGPEADNFFNGTGGGAETGPYRQSYVYDAWDNLKERSDRYWNRFNGYFANYNSNNRNPSWLYYADGRIRRDADLEYSYDAAGRVTSTLQYEATTNPKPSLAQAHDGDGQQVKAVETEVTPTGITLVTPTYSVRSSVLGGRVVAEVGEAAAAGQWEVHRRFVYAGGMLIARQWMVGTGGVEWVTQDPVTGSRAETPANYQTTLAAWREELDPMGVNAGTRAPVERTGDRGVGRSKDGSAELVVDSGGDMSCTMDGVVFDCASVLRLLASGAVVQCPNNDCGPQRRDFYNDETGEVESFLTQPFRAYADGTSGYFPPGMQYVGNGVIIDGEFSEFNRDGARGIDQFGGLANFFAPQNSASGGQQLSQCLRDAVRQFFPKQSAQGKDYSPIDDSRFKAGIPAWVRAGSKLPGAINPGAITLGLYDIHYDSNYLNLNGGNSEELKTILEEVSHAGQFINVWADLKPNMGMIAEFGVDGTGYEYAQNEWRFQYAASVISSGASYNNDIEKWAKNNANKILQQLVNDPQLQKQGNVCGFDLKKYTIQFIP